MCNTSPDTKKVLFPTSTIDVECTVTVSFEIPAVDFDRTSIELQLMQNRYGWIRGVRVDKASIARSLGMESTKFLAVGADSVDVNRITTTKYDEKGMVIGRHEEPR